MSDALTDCLAFVHGRCLEGDEDILLVAGSILISVAVSAALQDPEMRASLDELMASITNDVISETDERLKYGRPGNA